MGPDDEDDDKDDVVQGPDEEDFSAEELAAIEDMQKQTPAQQRDAEGASDDEPLIAKDAAKGSDAEKDEEDDDAEAAVTVKQGENGKSTEYVARAAYLREKEERKAARAAIAERDARIERLSGRFDVLANMLNVDENGQPKVKATADADVKDPWKEADIKPEDDYVAAMDQSRRRQAFDRVSHEKVIQRLDNIDKSSGERAVVDEYMADTRKFADAQVAKGEIVEIDDGKGGRTAVPAFTAGYLYMLNLRHAQLKSVGYDSEVDRSDIIAEEERNLVHNARAKKKSPAEVLYSYAISSGFKPPKAVSKSDTNGKNGNGKSADTRSTAEREIEERNDAIRRNRSIGNAGGAGFGGLTGKQIADMDEDEFGEFVSSYDKKNGEGSFERKYLGA